MLALENAHDILKVPLMYREDQGLWLRAKLRAIDRILMTQLRVDDNQLKRQRMDIMPDLLAKLAELKKAKPKLVS
jgi:hypothetical protein